MQKNTRTHAHTHKQNPHGGKQKCTFSTLFIGNENTVENVLKNMFFSVSHVFYHFLVNGHYCSAPVHDELSNGSIERLNTHRRAVAPIPQIPIAPSFSQCSNACIPLIRTCCQS